MARFTVWESRIGYTYEAKDKEEAVEKYINGDEWIGEAYIDELEVTEEDWDD